MNNLVSTDWLEKNIEKVRIFDGTWHLPSTNRNALSEFKANHIKTQFFLILIKILTKIQSYHICCLIKIIGKVL